MSRDLDSSNKKNPPGVEPAGSPLLVGMPPKIRRDLPRLPPFETPPPSSSARHDDGLRPPSERKKLSHCPGGTPMAVRSQDTWYVSFEQKRIRPAKRAFSRATETFRSKLKAKEFAKQKLAETQNVSAGTLNPHLPKRVISSAQMIHWLEEPTRPAAAP